jgi:hypothetical protein
MGFFAWTENIEKIRKRWYNMIHQPEKHTQKQALNRLREVRYGNQTDETGRIFPGAGKPE